MVREGGRAFGKGGRAGARRTTDDSSRGDTIRSYINSGDGGGSSDDGTVGSEADRSASIGGSDKPNDDDHGPTGGDTGSGEGTHEGSGTVQTGESGHSGESATERRNRIKREKYAAQRIADGKPYVGTASVRTDEQSIIDDVDTTQTRSEGHSVTVSLESDEVPPPPHSGKAEPKVRRNSRGSSKKAKTPDKGTVDQIATGLQTLYSVADMIVGFTANMLDKEYPQGALLLDDKKAEQLATSMAQMNLTSPKLANTINKYSAPTIFATTLLADVALKGMIVYGTFKQPSRSEQQKRVAQTDPNHQPTHYQ